MAGWTYNFNTREYNPILVKTDEDGNLQWQHTIDGDIDVWIYSVQQTTDGGYICAGFTNPNLTRRDIYLIKTDIDGSPQWQRTYGGSDYDEAYSVLQTMDDGYIIAGRTHSFGAGSSDIYIVKTDSDGEQQWQQTLGDNDRDEAYSIQQTADGDYIIAGLTNSFGAGSRDMYFVKIDSDGNQQWQQTYGGDSNDEAYSVRQTVDGGYILAGKTESFGAGYTDVFLVKTDSIGNLQWQRTFGDAGLELARSVWQVDDEGYVIAGGTESFGAGESDVYLIRTDAEGNLQWHRTFGGNNTDWAHSVRPTMEGGYIISGLTNSFGVGVFDFWLIKTGPDPVSAPPSFILHPSAFSLSEPFPNPFNSTVTIAFTVARPGYARLDLFDPTGRRVQGLFEGWTSVGERRMVWNAVGMPAGRYWAKLGDGSGNEVGRKLVLLK